MISCFLGSVAQHFRLEGLKVSLPAGPGICVTTFSGVANSESFLAEC